MTIFIKIIGSATLTFGIIGLVEVAIGLIKTGEYNLLRALVYSVLFAIGLGLH